MKITKAVKEQAATDTAAGVLADVGSKERGWVQILANEKVQGVLTGAVATMCSATGTHVPVSVRLTADELHVLQKAIGKLLRGGNA